MLPAFLDDEMAQLLAQAAVDRGGLVVDGEFVVGHKVKGDNLVLVDILQLLLLIGLQRGQLPAQSLLAIHGGGDKKENQQHKGDVCSGRGVESRDSMSLLVVEEHRRGWLLGSAQTGGAKHAVKDAAPRNKEHEQGGDYAHIGKGAEKDKGQTDA